MWDSDDQTLIRVVFDGAYTWNEYDATTDLIVSMMKSVAHKVDVIIVLDRDAPPPRGESAMAHFRRTQDQMPSNLGLLVTVGSPNFFTKMIFSTLIAMRQIKVNSRVVASEGEARQAIAKYRTTGSG
jgi:hypothetical protein